MSKKNKIIITLEIFAFALLFGFFFMHIFGFRIVLPDYAVEPHWVAIEIFATFAFSIATILISCLALYQADNTTSKQNKIALFDKRCEVYNTLTELIKIQRSFIVNKSKGNDERIHALIIASFNGVFEVNIGAYDVLNAIINAQNNLDEKYNIVCRAEWLFDKSISEKALNLNNLLYKIFSSSIQQEQIPSDDDLDKINILYEDVFPLMKANLKL